MIRQVFSMLCLGALIAGNVTSPLSAQETAFHQAPANSRAAKNPLAGQTAAVATGHSLYATNCSACHGAKGEGQGDAPALTAGATQTANAGELFWFITQGDVNNGMPAWSALAETERWQIVAYLKSDKLAQGAPATTSPASAPGAISTPAPIAPFTDFRYESPGTTRRITAADLPAPYATGSAGNGARIVARPANAWPKTLPGFKVEQFASGLDNPRLIRTAPNGDVFVAETRGGQIRVFRGLTTDGKPEQTEVFASGLHQPFGIAFYPPGPDPQWLYIGNTDAVVRFAYRNGDLHARAQPEQLAALPSGGHSTRDIRFSLDGKRMFVAVGSGSNVDDPDTTPGEKNRADILVYNADGSDMHVYASGIRNPVGLAVDPKTGELWCSVNERDGLGDNLVPDYITHVQEGGFYGWPWWYIGAHQDPRHAGKHAELKDRVIVPDVLLQPHNASLQLTFYDGAQFPAEYQGDIFAAEHGSWNKSTRAGYEVIRVPRHQSGHASGEYEDFLTGFVLDDGNVWGRPVGIAVARDGSLLVTDDGSNSIWRVSY
ncbi:MAG TPA: PQQ-dependent sugar dehydrogenase, partial [Rudaea sp.]|uniref:PQQ-dependent sugar dehydrogenase n=1 Tax=Rudaea sp. TaxID=2136325 RepID=UPI002F93EF66